jgi:hypothetical protein
VKFVVTSPINYACASRKGNMYFTQKLHQAIDCHSPRLIPNQCYFSDPPHFSVLSTFKSGITTVCCTVQSQEIFQPPASPSCDYGCCFRQCFRFFSRFYIEMQNIQGDHAKYPKGHSLGCLMVRLPSVPSQFAFTSVIEESEAKP